MTTRPHPDAPEREAFRDTFVDNEAEIAERLYDTLDALGPDAALMAAWGTSCATITFLREAGGPRLVSAYLRALGHLALAELDVTQPHELRADLP